jgi:hypothetical protein
MSEGKISDQALARISRNFVEWYGHGGIEQQ